MARNTSRSDENQVPRTLGMESIDNTEGRLYRILETGATPPKWARFLVLACDEWDDLWLPCIDRRHEHAHADEPWWCRRYRPRYPLHWPYMALTWVTGWVVPIEAS